MAARNRLVYATATCAVILLGLGSRWLSARLPAFVGAYVGDALWAVVAFLGVGFIFTSRSPLRVGAAALACSYAVELSQLSQAPWLNAVRHTRLGGLVLGYGFLWSDIGCYTVGVMLAVAAELAVLSRTQAEADLERSEAAVGPDGAG
jgi:hypothetical protein